MAGEISYINLNGEKRKIAGAGLAQEFNDTVAAQNAEILRLRQETSDLQSALLETDRGFASLVSGLKSGSVIEQTEDGFSVIINKIQYSVMATPDIEESSGKRLLNISLYGDGKLAEQGTFYCKAYGMANNVPINLYPGGIDSYFIITEGALSFTYDRFYSNLLIMVYDSPLCDTLICSTSVSLAKDSGNGIYTIEMSCNQGYVRNSKDTSDIVITTRLFRNGEDIHNKIDRSKYPFSYQLYWYSPQDEANYSPTPSDNGIFNIPKDKIGEKTTFYCEVDIDTEALEREVFNG